MSFKSVAFLAAGAVVLLSSCTSAPRARTLTVEMFDSSPVREHWVPAVLPSPLPPVLTDPGMWPAVIESLPARLPAKAAFALVAPAVPSTPAVMPKPSTAKPSRTASAAPVPAAAAPAPAAKAAAPTKPPPASPAVPAAASSAATQAAGSATGGAVGTSGSYGRLREIYARQGDVLQVGLDGVGFLFLGLPDRQADGVSFKTKENRNNKTWFTFQALKLGTYDLDFLQQDNMAGKTSRETVRVHVVSEQDFNAAVAPQQAPDAAAAAPAEVGDPAFALKLTSIGSYQAAVVELLKGYKDGNPALNDQIAGLYMRMGSYDAAEKYYAKNLAPQGSYTPGAVIGLVRIAALQNDQQGLIGLLRQFLALKDPSIEEPLIQAVRMEKGRSEIGMALDLAGEYVQRFPNGTWRDEADYLSAQLLEADSSFRDIARARSLYAGIVNGRPESVFADAARQRLQYIDRHFIQVR